MRRNGSSATGGGEYRLYYHFVFVPVGRRPVLKGEVGNHLRDMLRDLCQANGIEIVKGHIHPDHLHLHLRVPPNMPAARVSQLVKTTTTPKLLKDLRRTQPKFNERQVWCRGHMVATSGIVTEEMIQNYVEEQDSSREADDIELVEA